jgi:uncharacterized protein YfiM (DUF2279 family)
VWRFCVPVGLAVLLTTGPAVADEWWGRDKALHLGVSAGIAAGAYGVAALAWKEPWKRALVGGGTALFAGAAKETYDGVGPGDPSGRDLAWDAAGTAVGVGLALSIDALAHRRSRHRQRDPVVTVARSPRMDW